MQSKGSAANAVLYEDSMVVWGGWFNPDRPMYTFKPLLYFNVGDLSPSLFNLILSSPSPPPASSRARSRSRSHTHSRSHTKHTQTTKNNKR